MFTHNGDNHNHTDKNSIICCNPETISRIRKKMPHRSTRNKWLTICRPTHHERSQNDAKNCSPGWMDSIKASEVTQQMWIIKCLKMFKISDQIINLFTNAMTNWRVESTGKRQTLAGVKILKGIFHWVSLSKLPFVNAMMSLNHVFRCTEGYKFTKPEEKIYHLRYMNDMKIFRTNKKEL